MLNSIKRPEATDLLQSFALRSPSRKGDGFLAANWPCGASAYAGAKLGLFGSEMECESSFPKISMDTIVTLRTHADVVAAEAQHHATKIGVARARVRADKVGEIVSISVANSYRRRGVGTALLRALELELSHRGCRRAEATVIKNSLPAGIEELVMKEEWSPFQARGVLCLTDYEALSHARWLGYRATPSRFTLFPWKELTIGERRSISSRPAWFPENLDPLQEELMVDTTTSVGMRCGSDIMGWCIFHRLSGGATRCTSLFLRKELRGSGRAIHMLAHAIHLHRQANQRPIIFDVSFKRTEMVRLLRHGLMPYLKSLSLINKTTKQLSSHILGRI